MLEFDIDAFIEAILFNTSVEATQINRQRATQIGDENTITQNNVQELVVGVPEPSPGKMLGVLLVIIGIRTVYKKSVSLFLITQHHN